MYARTGQVASMGPLAQIEYMKIVEVVKNEEEELPVPHL